MVAIIKFLLKIICFVLCVVLVYCFIFKKYIIRPYKFQLYIGKPRSGKTTMMTKAAIQAIKHNRPVYCNVNIEVPGVRLFNAVDINLDHFFEPESLILIDEPNLYWDNRTFKDKGRKGTIEWFRLYGHNRVNIKMYTQTLDVDKKLRYLASDCYICKKYLGTITVSRRLKKQITIKESAVDAESQIVDELDFVPIFYPGSFYITFIPRWTKYFDSYSMPAGVPIQYKTKERTLAATNGKFKKRSILDFSRLSGQYGEESELEGKVN